MADLNVKIVNHDLKPIFVKSLVLFDGSIYQDIEIKKSEVDFPIATFNSVQFELNTGQIIVINADAIISMEVEKCSNFTIAK